MLVNSPKNDTPLTMRRLGDIKPGKGIELKSPEGIISFYMVCRSTVVEGIKVPTNRTMLTNLATGRIVFKLSNLSVFELSGVIATKYLEVNPDDEPNYNY